MGLSGNSKMKDVIAGHLRLTIRGPWLAGAAGGSGHRPRRLAHSAETLGKPRAVPPLSSPACGEGWGGGANHLTLTLALSQRERAQDGASLGRVSLTYVAER